jgi:hypothetical protein
VIKISSFIFLTTALMFGALEMAGCASASSYIPSNSIRETEKQIRSAVHAGMLVDELKDLMSNEFHARLLDENGNDYKNQLLYVISDPEDTSGVGSSVIFDFRYDDDGKISSISSKFVNSGP